MRSIYDDVLCLEEAGGGEELGTVSLDTRVWGFGNLLSSSAFLSLDSNKGGFFSGCFLCVNLDLWVCVRDMLCVR